MPEPKVHTLGRYDLIEKFAVGGMAELYKARVKGAHGFEKPLVIKRILPRLAADPAFVSMFIDEAKITSQLSHPKIVQVYELEMDGDELFIVMEYVEGLDLLTLIRQCRADEANLSPALAAHLASEVLDALDYAHHAKSPDGELLSIVHRDVSPGNVLVSHRGDVKLVDFGIARASRRRHETQTGTLKGKYGYMSPEQIVGKPVDGRSDLFSVAVVMSELLMMRRLFAAPTDLDVLLMVRDVRLDRLDEHGGAIPPGLRTILERALQRDPDDRFIDAAAFREALADWLFSEGKRIGPRQVEEFIDELSRTESEKIKAAVVSEAVVHDELADLATMSGPVTKARQLEAEQAARVGRALFASNSVLDADAEEDDIPIVFDDEPLAEPRVPSVLPEPIDPKDSEGSFEQASPFKVLHQIANHRLDGLLVVERDGAVKETYFHAGDPLFIRSNIGSERLGEYLVAQGAISSGELTRALAVLPHFGGRLGDTLVGLKLMRPLDAFRHLSRQVRAKLLDVCTWTSGRYRWHSNRANPWPALPLHLETLEIMGAGAAALDEHGVRQWAMPHADRRPSRASSTPARLDAFGLGARLGHVYATIDGRSTVRELIGRHSSHDRVDFLRMLYLLTETDAVRW